MLIWPQGHYNLQIIIIILSIYVPCFCFDNKFTISESIKLLFLGSFLYNENDNIYLEQEVKVKFYTAKTLALFSS